MLPYVILIVIAAELAERAMGLPFAREVAWIGTLCIVVLSWSRLGFRDYYLLSFAATMAVVQVVFSEHPEEALSGALDQAGFLLVFIFLLGMLHEAASTSPSVSACGEYLTRQPAGRRYYALNGGTALLSVLFNIGVISFLVPLIQKGIERATPGHALNPIRERRQISAMLRGFAWCVVWSPTAIAPLAVSELLPSADRFLWMTYGFVLFLIILVAGALEDSWRFRTYRPVAKIVVPAFPKQGALGFLAACACLFGMTALFVHLTGDTVIFGLLMACPIMLVGWLAVQYGMPKPGSWSKTQTRLKVIAVENLPKSAPVAITLACSGFIGHAAAGFVPAAELADALMLNAIPDFLLLGMIPIALTLLSLLALSPIMTAVFFGSIFGALPELPADPTLIALAISCGWALSMTFSPFATVVLLVGRVGNMKATTVTWGWNFAFSMLGAGMLFPIFAILTGGH